MSMWWNDGPLKAAVRSAVQPAARDVAKVAAARAQWRHVRNSIRPVPTGSTSAVIQVGAGDWRRLEFGTRAHGIAPRRRQALKFPDGGFARSGVPHPGTDAHPFLRPAIPVFIPAYIRHAKARL